MKRLLSCLPILFLALIANATGQEGDVIFIDGARWELLGNPCGADSVLYHDLEAVLPKNRGYVTSNWDGFTAYWSIQQDLLCLDSIRYENYDPKVKSGRIPSDTMLRVFSKYVEGNRIVASWLSGEVRVATGKMLYYEHAAFNRNYEEEMILSIEKGKVTARKEYHNYVVKGFSFDEVNPQNRNELRKMFPLHVERYPELAGKKRIIFSIKHARVDAQGNLVECEVKARPDIPQLAEEMAEALKAYHPWRVMFINGEFRAYGISGYGVPYLLDE